MRQVAKKGLITVIATSGVLAVTGGYAYADAAAAGSATGSPGILSGNTVQVPVHVPVNACGNTVSVIGVLNPAFGNSCANTSHGGAGTGTTAGGGGSTATGGSSNSPGVGSGNTVQVPVHAPVNACGNSANVVGALNPAFGNHCANTSHGGTGTTAGGGGSTATGGSSNSPGVGSGNTVQVPVHVPVNACGNTVSVIGLLNPVFGNGCGNGTPVTPPPPTTPTPPVTPPTPPTTPGTPSTPVTPPAPRTPAAPPAPRHARLATPQEMLAHTGADGIGAAALAAAGALAGGFLLYRRGRALRG